ncbi:hypothetical protein VTK26DRAFT_6273 [Humicola hyalothermophila]
MDSSAEAESRSMTPDKLASPPGFDGRHKRTPKCLQCGRQARHRSRPDGGSQSTDYSVQIRTLPLLSESLLVRWSPSGGSLAVVVGVGKPKKSETRCLAHVHSRRADGGGLPDCLAPPRRPDSGATNACENKPVLFNPLYSLHQ